MNGRSTLFRISQGLNRKLRRNVIDKSRYLLNKIHQRPYDPKLIGFIGEVKSMDYIRQCEICKNPHLEYNFMEYLTGKIEKSWTDIECKECNEYIVEIKTTKRTDPITLNGGSYKNYLKMKHKPFLLILPEVYKLKKTKEYHFGKPMYFTPKEYIVLPNKTNSKSTIHLPNYLSKKITF